MIRCYNRLSIYIAFFALAGLFLLVQRLTRRHVDSRLGFMAYATALGAVLVLGAFDQTEPPFVPQYAAEKKLYTMDAEFGKRMEAVLPAGAMVYELPYVRFPESLPAHNLSDYELFRPYLHTRTLRWSYGTMKGRELGSREAAFAKRPLTETLPELTKEGFRGVYLDRAGFADNGAAVEADLARLLGAAPIISQTGLQVFFDLTRYAQTHHNLVSTLP